MAPILIQPLAESYPAKAGGAKTFKADKLNSAKYSGNFPMICHGTYRLKRLEIANAYMY